MEAEVPLEQAHEDMHHHAQHGESWISGVALSAALLAALAAVTALMSGSCEVEALLEQAKASNQWNYFQAKSIKQNLLQSKMDMITLLGKDVPEKDKAKYTEYDKDKAEIKEKAEELEAESTAHIHQHETFSKALTMLQVAIAIAAVSALSRKKPFWYVSMLFGAAGIYFFIIAFTAGGHHGHHKEGGEKSAEHAAEKPAEGHGEKPAEAHGEKPAEKPAEGEKKEH